MKEYTTLKIEDVEGEGEPLHPKVDWNRLSDAQRAITAWANSAFPNRTSDGAFIKLLEELGEYAADRNAALEFADLLILLLDLASMHKIDVAKALEQKMQINQRRRWIFDRITGLAHHVEEKNDGR